jgi:hypothetical protein
MMIRHPMKTPRKLLVVCLALLAGLLTSAPANAQSGQNGGYGVGHIDEGLVVGAIAGVAVVVGIGVTWLVLHNRGVVVGCIAEADGKRTLADASGKTYSLSDTGPSLPVGDRAKLKGHKSGPSSAPSFQVEKVLKDYGHCAP